jgi:hypothetical protein
VGRYEIFVEPSILGTAHNNTPTLSNNMEIAAAIF